MRLSRFEILFYALALAFCWVRLLMPNLVRKYFLWRYRRYTPRTDRIKPLDCMMCMTGWLALTLALISGYGWLSVLLLVGGVFIGAIAEGIIMRYL